MRNIIFYLFKMNTYGLDIHLESFYLNRNIIQANDKVRVSITTIPEENKEAFVVDADKTGNSPLLYRQC